MTALLLTTALAVTLTTFQFLRDEQTNNFHEAFEQFARTVADAAVEQQVNVRAAYDGICNAVSTAAYTSQANWPYYTTPLYETYARRFRESGNIEVFTIFNIVKDKDRSQYEKWAKENHEEMVIDGHMAEFGNTDRLTPEKYVDSITHFTPDGPIPDETRDQKSLKAIGTKHDQYQCTISVMEQEPYLRFLYQAYMMQSLNALHHGQDAGHALLHLKLTDGADFISDKQQHMFYDALLKLSPAEAQQMHHKFAPQYNMTWTKERIGFPLDKNVTEVEE